MAVWTTEQAGDALRAPVVAIGNFDGVHRGHQTVVARAVAEARARNVDAAVLTFEPHPVLHFRPNAPEFRLTSVAQKAAQLHALGVDGVVVATFDAQLATLTPQQFVDDVLVGKLGASAVLVGADFRFGARRAGDVDALRELGGGRFDVLVLPQLQASDEAISSTRIRTAVREADFALVTALLGRPFEVAGEVVTGDQIGRTFGFPTANIASETPLLPPDGIYATRLHTDHVTYDAASYVGTRPAVAPAASLGDAPRVVEAYCLDVDQLDLYGARVRLEFVERVREDRDFETHDALIAQMRRDVVAVRAALTG